MQAMKMQRGYSRPSGAAAARQTGYATLGIGLVLLFVLSLGTIYLSRSGIVDLRSSADKTRYGEALAAAEERLEIGIAWMTVQANRDSLTPAAWALCTDGTIKAALPGGVTSATWDGAFGDVDGDAADDWRCQCRQASTAGGAVSPCTAEAVYLATPVANPGSLYFVVAGGHSADGSASVVVKQGLNFFKVLFPGAENGPPPLMGAGNVPLNGTFNVVANPNGGGRGVPVSLWSKSVVDDPQGSAKTCHAEDFNGGCSNPLSKKDVKGVDIIDGDTTNFPPDMFEYVFGVGSANYNLIKSQATVLPDCSTLGPGSSGFVWVTGDCTIPSNTTYGSRANPLLLVVESADFRMNANSTYYGLIFAFDPNGNAGSMTMNGGATLRGAILSNDAVEMGVNINGTFNLIYDVPTMNAIIDPPDAFLKLIARMPGSWADYL
ncbi:MAG: pilus assembly PilX N-terminal domain-containing protein [Gallionellaceae bacterium]|nr:pilus assembly PilX N-terminal domain-containing protein [Gallionellaceae bacterium]